MCLWVIVSYCEIFVFIGLFVLQMEVDYLMGLIENWIRNDLENYVR